MRQKVITLMLLSLTFLSANLFAQAGPKKKMYDQLDTVIKKYQLLYHNAYEKGDEKLGQRYYDTITNNIKGSYIGNYLFEAINGKVISTKSLTKPMYMVVSASWCAPCMTEIPALNQIAAEYGSKVDFVVLFWNLKPELGKLAEKYYKNIIIVPSKQKDTSEIHHIDISGFRHQLGYPCAYLVDRQKRIIEYSAGAPMVGSFDLPDGKKLVITEKDAYNYNYKRLKQEVEQLVSTEK